MSKKTRRTTASRFGPTAWNSTAETPLLCAQPANRQPLIANCQPLPANRQIDLAQPPRSWDNQAWLRTCPIPFIRLDENEAVILSTGWPERAAFERSNLRNQHIINCRSRAFDFDNGGFLFHFQGTNFKKYPILLADPAFGCGGVYLCFQYVRTLRRRAAGEYVECCKRSDLQHGDFIGHILHIHRIACHPDRLYPEIPVKRVCL
jgi:hypothetical protein